MHLVELVNLGLLLVGLVEVLNNVGDIVVVLALGTGSSGLRSGVLSVHGLVGFSELAERGERVRAELVQDTGHKLGELFVDTVTVDSESVARLETVDCVMKQCGEENVKVGQRSGCEKKLTASTPSRECWKSLL